MMLIDVLRPETWEELNDSVKSYLALAPKIRVRCFQGLPQALFEVAQGTAQFMSHKRSIGVIKGQTPVFDPLLPYYYKETYEVNELSHLQLSNVKEWVDGLKKETCFVMFAEDHPVTGELYPFADELDKLLNDKRIFSFRISHFRHFFEQVEIRPYTVRLCSYSVKSAVALVGERFRSPSMVAQNMEWDKKSYIQELENSSKGRTVNAAAVEAFEKSLQGAVEFYFKPGTLRLYDRAVCVFPDASAEAVATAVLKKLGTSIDEEWQKISSTNMCHWSGTKMFRHWWLPTPSQEALRGLLVIGSEMLNTKDFAKLLISSYEEIQQQQSWSV